MERPSGIRGRISPSLCHDFFNIQNYSRLLCGSWIGALVLISSIASAASPTATLAQGERDFREGRCAAAMHDAWWPLAMQGDASAQTNLGIAYQYGFSDPPNNEGSFFWIQKAAGRGTPLAEFEMGRAYNLGVWVPQNYDLALQWYTKAARAGNSDAELGLYWLYDGLAAVKSSAKDFKPDYKTGLSWLRKSASQGNILAERLLGSALSIGSYAPHDNKQAIYWLEKAANGGSMQAAADLGNLYRNIVTPHDYRKSFGWYQRADALQYPDAPLQLAFYYEIGLEVPVDRTKAYELLAVAMQRGFHWFSSSELKIVLTDFNRDHADTRITLHAIDADATQGDKTAEALLGILYTFGTGVPQDKKKADALFQSASDNGYIPATELLAQDIEASDTKRAMDLHRLAASHGDVMGEWNIGKFYEGLTYGGQKDIEKALPWLTKAAQSGSLGAQMDLGYLYKSGDGVPYDFARAVQWFQAAADQGYLPGEYELADIYFWGRPLSMDPRKWLGRFASATFSPEKQVATLLGWYQKAADGGYTPAEARWGLKLLCSDSPQDHQEGMRWLKRAAETDGNLYVTAALDLQPSPPGSH